ncbi:MAG: hypothetical protein AAF927_24560 [Bacteroidota bacterium]
MKLSKVILAFSALFLMIGILPVSAQRKGDAPNLTELKLSEKAKASVVNQLKALKDVGPSVRQATKSVALTDIKGYDIQIPDLSNKVIHIIFFKTSGDIRMSDRSEMDAFKAGSDLGAAFKRMGIDPEKGMAFQFNPKTLKFEPFHGVPGTGKG